MLAVAARGAGAAAGPPAAHHQWVPRLPGQPRSEGRLRPPGHSGVHRRVLPGQPRREGRLRPPGHTGVRRRVLPGQPRRG
eukprot:12756607-Heterocapsa_arctica.AAC.1